MADFCTIQLAGFSVPSLYKNTDSVGQSHRAVMKSMHRTFGFVGFVLSFITRIDFGFASFFCVKTNKKKLCVWFASCCI